MIDRCFSHSLRASACLLENIRADQTIQNKLLSNLARTDGVLQRVTIELAALEKIKADLIQAKR